MRSQRAPLLAIFRTPLQGRILAEVYLRDRDKPLNISELARVLDEPLSSVHREVSRLVEDGLIDQTQVGRIRTLRRPVDDLVVGPLTDLLNVTFGPVPVLTELLDQVRGIESAFLYGSWAARYAGESGPSPRDVDVLVVGDPDLDDLDDAVTRAEERLRREVSVRSVTPERWRHATGDPFLSHLRERPLIALELGGAHAR